MAKEIYTAIVFDESHSLRADWSNASSPIERQDEDGNWESTGWVVADHAHNPTDAMRCELELSVAASGDDADEYATAIEAALFQMMGKRLSSMIEPKPTWTSVTA